MVAFGVLAIVYGVGAVKLTLLLDVVEVFGVASTEYDHCMYNNLLIRQLLKIGTSKLFFTIKESILPGQRCPIQDSNFLLTPIQFLRGLSLFITFVLIFVLVPVPQVAEHSPISHKLHSQVIGAPKY